MKNRFAALFLLVALLSAVIPAQVLAAKAKPEDAIAFMNTMSIITESESAEDRLDTKLSRIQFVSYLARALNINETSVSDKDYFYDIPSDHWGKFSVNSLVEQGVITVGAERLFRPNDIITKQEAAVIATMCMGRGQEAILRGGFPTGYMAIATQEDLFDGINAPELTVSDTAIFLYNMMNAEIMQPALPGEPGTLAKNDKTILSEYHDIYYSDGFVNAVWGASVDEKAANNKNEVIIDGEVFVSSKWRYDYLGQNIKFFYKETEDDQKEIVYIFSDADEKNKVHYITSDDYVGYEDGKIVYFDARDSKKSVKVASGATVIRNGINVSENLETALAPFYGTMRVIDSGDSSGSDVVIIEDYVSIAVGSVSSETRTLYNKYNFEHYIDLSEALERKIIYQDATGNEVDFGAIVQNTIVSVAQSADKSFALVKINSGNVTGIIDKVSVDGEDDTIIEIDGEEYTVLKSFYDSYKSIFTRGGNGNFKMDVLGKIIYFSLDNSSEMQFVFLIKGQLRSELDGKDLDSESAIFKIFTDEGVLTKVICSEKVKIDGETYQNHRAIVEKFEVEGVFKPQLVRIKYDNDGNIKIIDTNTKGSSEGRYSLNLRNPIKTRPYRHRTGMVDKTIFVPAATKVMVVPEEGLEDTDDAKAYSIGTFSQIPNGETRMDLYQLDSESLKTDIVVWHKPAKPLVDNWQPIYVVEKITQELNNDDEPTDCFVLDATGNNEKFLVATDYVTKVNSLSEATVSGDGLSHMNPKSIGQGDIIRIATDYKNEIVDIQLLLDYSIAMSNPNDSFFDNAIHPVWAISGGGLPGNYNDGVTQSYGYVSHFDGTYFQWGYTRPGDVNQAYSTELNRTIKYYVYDPDEPDDKLKAGTVNDLVGYYQNKDNYSKIYANTHGAVIQQCIIYK